MIFLVQFGINKHLFCWSLKNLLVLIYSKLHSKSCDYLYKNKDIIARNGLYTHVFLKGLKIYHNFCVMLRLCAKSLDKSFRPPEKKKKVLT